MNVREAFRGLPPLQIRPRPTARLVSIAPLIKPGERGEKHHPTGQYLNALRLEWDRPAPTLIANAFRSSSLVFHPDIDAGISIDEAKRLQSIPDQCALVGNYRQRWSLIGRGVPPLLMRAVAKHLREKILDKTDAKSGIQITEAVAPFFVHGGTTIHNGDALLELRNLRSNSVDCVITSPPYLGLRDYGIDGQIGLEETVEEYVAKLLAVTAEIHRVLKSSGTFWFNIGDKYATSNSAGSKMYGNPEFNINRPCRAATRVPRNRIPPGFKRGDLLLLPHRLAIALHKQGWHFRNDIIWVKPNPTPESMRDRMTRSHEHILFLTKGEKYYFNWEANQETSKTPAGRGNSRDNWASTGRRNRRDCWSIPVRPYRGPHFAGFPEQLVERCLQVGCPPGGTCLDPFAGKGTVGVVAKRLGLNAVLIDLNPSYCALAKEEIMRADSCKAARNNESTNEQSTEERER